MTLSVLRTGRITASRLPAILGLSPYSDRASTLREMVRQALGSPQEFVGNVATDWGHAHEADAIAAYERMSGRLVMDEQLFVAHPEYPIAATLDGTADTDRVIEAKCPYVGDWMTVDQRPDYEAQVRLQLECTGRRYGDLICWRPSGLSVSTVEFDADWFPSVLPVIEEFFTEYHDALEDTDKSAPYLAPLVDERIDSDWQLAAFEWNEAKAARDRAQDSLDAASEVLRKLSDGKKSKGSGVQVIPSNRSGKVDWATAAKDYSIDADKYREPGTTILTVRKAAP